MQEEQQMNGSVSLVFPHQLYKTNPALSKSREVYLVEEYLYFKQFCFHKQKIRFHRASMKYYESFLSESGFKVQYIEANDSRSDVRNLINWLGNKQFHTIHLTEVDDDWLCRRVEKKAKEKSVLVKQYESPMFLNSLEQLNPFFKNKKKFFQSSFYIEQRKKRNILLVDNYQPLGGKWSFDSENRKKYPKKKDPPKIEMPGVNRFYEEAGNYVRQHFNGHVGEIPDNIIYPATHAQADAWFRQFLEVRFKDFGIYEDAIVKEELFLHHSVLSPLLNSGLQDK
jgi:deoxyribodipyrimidine photolyase-related protein